MTELREGLEAIRTDSLDESYARSSEYAEYVLRAAEIASTAYRDQKIRLLAAVAAGASTGATSDLLLEKYLSAADAISVDHVEGLAKFQRGEMWVNRLDVPEQRMLADEFPDLNETEVQVLIRDLATQGFVEDAGGSRFGVRSGDVWRITPVGLSFLSFLRHHGDVGGGTA